MSLHYVDYGEKEDEELVELREQLMDYLETGASEEFCHKLYELLEVEREMTLREDR